MEKGYRKEDIQIYDLIIIGGGAAGMMAAISAKRKYKNYSIAIIDRTFALGRKILVAGAGRCNITNVNLQNSVEERYYGATNEFIKSIFNQFGYEEIINFFKDLGIELYTERKTSIGKLFPVTDQAKTVTLLLEDEIKRLGLDVYLNHDVRDIILNDKNHDDERYNFSIVTQKIEKEIPVGDKRLFRSKYLILSAGGKTYPALGSNGSGYTLAQKLGHSIVYPVPSALPLVGKDPLSQEINGVKMEIEVTSYINDKQIKNTINDVMFTQYGLSGPAILNISREISIHLKRNKGIEAVVLLNFIPGKKINEVKEILNERWFKRPDQEIQLSLNGLFSPKFPPVFLKVIGINPVKKVSELTLEEKNIIYTQLTSYKYIITDTRGWNEAEFTAGGVNSNEVMEKTLKSKRNNYLYLCGEILDVDGDVGGFNLSWAWSSGYIAGMLQ